MNTLPESSNSSWKITETSKHCYHLVTTCGWDAFLVGFCSKKDSCPSSVDSLHWYLKMDSRILLSSCHIIAAYTHHSLYTKRKFTLLMFVKKEEDSQKGTCRKERSGISFLQRVYASGWLICLDTNSTHSWDLFFFPSKLTHDHTCMYVCAHSHSCTCVAMKKDWRKGCRHVCYFKTLVVRENVWSLFITSHSLHSSFWYPPVLLVREITLQSNPFSFLLLRRQETWGTTSHDQKEWVKERRVGRGMCLRCV